jgi:molybdate transport system substrate-binding protein
MQIKSEFILQRCALVCACTVFAAAVAVAQAPPPGGAPPGAMPHNPLMDEKLANAQPDDVRVFATVAFMHQLEQVREQAEKAISHHIYVEYGSARGNLRDEILGGQSFEVAVLLPDVDADLLKAGKILPGDHDIASVKTAIALRGDADVDVSTPEALKKTLLGASLVRYSPTGVAHSTALKLLNDLGIADSVKDSNRGAAPPGPPSMAPLTPGQYEINIFPLSEVMNLRGQKNLGPVIAPFQVTEHIQAVVGSQAKDKKTAQALVKFLESPALDAPIKDGGMEKGKGG